MTASDQSLHILFFAARRIQKEYFLALAHHLNLAQVKSQVINFKWQNWRGIFKVHAISPEHVRPIVKLLIKEKQASPKGQSKSKVYWLIYEKLKTIEATWLLACYTQLLQSKAPNHAALWNGLKFRQAIFAKAANILGIPVLYFENGLLPGMTTVDPKGINYLNSMPRMPDQYERFETTTAIGNAAFNEGSSGHSPYLFVPFQVNTDSQIVQFSPFIKHMSQLFHYIVDANRQLKTPYKIVFKTHPACSTNYDQLIQEANSDALVEFSNQSTNELIDGAFAIITINSTVGIESILANKRVVTLGEAFYNLSPLVLHVESNEKLYDTLQELADWQPDQSFRAQFLNSLAEYQVLGRWQDKSEEHLSAMVERICSLCPLSTIERK